MAPLARTEQTTSCTSIPKLQIDIHQKSYHIQILKILNLFYLCQRLNLYKATYTERTKLTCNIHFSINGYQVGLVKHNGVSKWKGSNRVNTVAPIKYLIGTQINVFFIIWMIYKGGYTVWLSSTETFSSDNDTFGFFLTSKI